MLSVALLCQTIRMFQLASPGSMVERGEGAEREGAENIMRRTTPREPLHRSESAKGRRSGEVSTLNRHPQ